MNKKNKYVVFIDLDKTLLKLNSGVILIFAAYKKGLMSTLQLIHAVYLSILYKCNLRETSAIIDDMPKWMAGLSEKEIKLLGEDIFKKRLINEIRPGILGEIKKHREQSAKIVILSATLPYICLPVANFLELDDIICSKVEVVNGFFTGKPIGKLCFDDEKLVSLKKYCEDNNHSLSTAYFYGDSIADFPVLKAVGNPVCVNPDKELLKKAIEKKWIIKVWN